MSKIEVHCLRYVTFALGLFGFNFLELTERDVLEDAEPLDGERSVLKLNKVVCLDEGCECAVTLSPRRLALRFELLG